MTTVHDIGGYRVPDQVLSAVREASNRTGVDFGYMLAKAATESAFQPDARAATSNATGLYQFIDSTWLSMVNSHGHKYGLGHYADRIAAGPGGRPSVADPALRREILDLRYDPRLNALMAAEYALENQNHLARHVGGSIGSTELYMAHFLGAHGAERFLNALREAPNRSGAQMFPAAAAANRPVFYDRAGQERSLREIHQFFDRRVTRDLALAELVPGGANMPGAGGTIAANAQRLGPSFFGLRGLDEPMFPGRATRPIATANPALPENPPDAPSRQAPPSSAHVAYHPASAVGPAAGVANIGGQRLSLWAFLTASADVEPS